MKKVALVEKSQTEDTEKLKICSEQTTLYGKVINFLSGLSTIEQFFISVWIISLLFCWEKVFRTKISIDSRKKIFSWKFRVSFLDLSFVSSKNSNSKMTMQFPSRKLISKYFPRNSSNTHTKNLSNEKKSVRFTCENNNKFLVTHYGLFIENVKDFPEQADWSDVCLKSQQFPDDEICNNREKRLPWKRNDMICL